MLEINIHIQAEDILKIYSTGVHTGDKWKKDKQTSSFPMQLVPIRNCDKEAIYHQWECITAIARTPCTQSRFH